MARVEHFDVTNANEMRARVREYASKGYVTIQDRDNYAILSRRKEFNWVLAIICLFIPIIGWIALVFMVLASARGSHTVEIELVNAQ